MTTDQLTPEQKANAEFFPRHFDAHGWGLGVGVVTKRDDVGLPAGAFGWDGGLGTSAYVDPTQGLVGVLLDAACLDVAFTAERVPRLLADDLWFERLSTLSPDPANMLAYLCRAHRSPHGTMRCRRGAKHAGSFVTSTFLPKGRTAMETTTTTQTTGTATSAATVWTVDPAHTSVTFGVRHMMVSTVRGEFQKVSGSVTYNPNRLEATAINVTIDVASISTREPKRDEHLRSADFFDVEKFPTIEFRSKGATKKKDGSLEVSGELTIHGTTRVVVLDVEEPTAEYADPWGFIRMGASAKTKIIKRSDFGMTWNTVLEAGGVIVGDDISLQLDVELQRNK